MFSVEVGARVHELGGSVDLLIGELPELVRHFRAPAFGAQAAGDCVDCGFNGAIHALIDRREKGLNG